MLLVIEKSSIQAFLVSEEKGMQFHIAVFSSIGIPLARLRHHVEANCAYVGDGAETY